MEIAGEDKWPSYLSVIVAYRKLFAVTYI